MSKLNYVQHMHAFKIKALFSNFGCFFSSFGRFVSALTFRWCLHFILYCILLYYITYISLFKSRSTTVKLESAKKFFI